VESPIDIRIPTTKSDTITPAPPYLDCSNDVKINTPTLFQPLLKSCSFDTVFRCGAIHLPNLLKAGAKIEKEECTPLIPLTE